MILKGPRNQGFADLHEILDIFYKLKIQIKLIVEFNEFRCLNMEYKVNDTCPPSENDVFDAVNTGLAT